MGDETTQSSSGGGGTTQTATSQSGGDQSATTSQASQAGQTTQSQGQTQQTSQQAPVRPEYIPETFWDAKAGRVTDDKAFASHLNEIIARDAAETVRRNGLPQKAEDYKVELPGDFTPPEGVKYEFRTDDPLLAQARTMAHELGIGQEGFSKLLGLYAGTQVASQQAITNARNAEIAKLGTTGPARIDALSTFYTAHLGQAEGAQIMARVLTASDVALHEKLVAKLASQGGASFSGRGREASEAKGRVSNEQFAKMTSAERLDYARKFDQSQFQAPSNGRAA